jgi:hypothetical protein
VTGDQAEPARYEIRVDGVLDDQWADWPGGLQLETTGGQTIISGVLPISRPCTECCAGSAIWGCA